MKYTARDIAEATVYAAKAYPRYAAYCVTWLLLSVAAIAWFCTRHGWIYLPIIIGFIVLLSVAQRLAIRIQKWAIRRDEADQ